VGSRFGPYHLKRLLGSGGFGEVYEAEDTSMQRVVALKLLSSSYSHNPAFRERLFREARTAGRLHDPHVVPIHRCGEIDGQLYIDMRLIDGTDLQSTLDRGGALPPARSVAIVRQIAAALDAAHAETVIHRDVKPANILLGKDDFACLVDFGLANAATDTKLTSEGTTIGSFAYLAPERLASGQVTPGADIYALACVLYECLTGVAPYEGRDEIPAIVAAHLTAPVPRPSQQRPGIPIGFDEVIARGMAKEPQERYASAGELGAAAQRALGSPAYDRAWAPTTQVPTQVPTTPTTPTAQTAQTAPTQGWVHPQSPVTPPPAHLQPPVRPRSRRRTMLTIAAIALVAVVAVVAVVVATVAIVATSRTPDPTQQAAPTSSSTAPPAMAAPATSTAPPLNATRLPIIGFGQLGGVAVSTAGDVYVVETSNPRIYKLAPNSTAPVEVPFRQLTKPKCVAVDEAGNLYVADWKQNTGRIWKLAPGAANPVELPFGEILPTGVASDAAGNVLVATRDRILQLAPGATTPTVLPFGAGLLDSVALDSAGNVYAAQMGRVLKLAPGAVSPTQLPFTQLGRAQGVAIDSQGNVYVIDNADGMGRLLKLAPGATSSTVVAAPENQSFGGVAVDAAGTVYLTENNRLLRVVPG
jgi:serine/threonine-protein kinase